MQRGNADTAGGKQHTDFQRPQCYDYKLRGARFADRGKYEEAEGKER